MSTELLIQCCAPTLAGMKTGSIYSCPYETRELADKKVALFGSYGLGDGEWMRSWEDSCADAGITLAVDSVICNDAPDDDALEACAKLGKALA